MKNIGEPHRTAPPERVDSTVPPSQTAWWDDRAVREAVISFVVGFAVSLASVLLVLHAAGWSW